MCQVTYLEQVFYKTYVDMYQNVRYMYVSGKTHLMHGFSMDCTSHVSHTMC